MLFKPIKPAAPDGEEVRDHPVAYNHGMDVQRLLISVQGAVQGVGFRPFVYRLARRLGITGLVWNSSGGVEIEAQGGGESLREFVRLLRDEKPAPAVISGISAVGIPVRPGKEFVIAPSREGSPATLVTPDLAVCPDCVRELLDPSDRRHRYPFINCTNCGPRFSILLSLPYDRPNTTMRDFRMCPDCAREYEDPLDRRFHAQPVACPVCGPRLRLLDPEGGELSDGDTALRNAVTELQRGGVVALKGLGGFQLLVRADSDTAVQLLRKRKRRPAKPLALLVRGIDEAEALCEISEGERELLLSPAAPITLLKRRSMGVSAGVAPDSPFLGVMLPATPLHYLLASDSGFPLVATSGNATGEPICTDNQDALTKLGGVADLFLVHDRPIARQVDDSVAACLSDGPLILRRARGYAPLPVTVPRVAAGTLAVGGHLANTGAISIKGGVILSQHIGDLGTLASVRSHRRALDDLQTLFGRASRVAGDIHPDYASTASAERTGLPRLSVQHHYAHILGCMAENGTDPPVLGVAWDGVGLGTDNSAWGGEFLLVGENPGFERVACLRPFPLPGGDAAALEPRRSALGLLWEMNGILPPSFGNFSDPELAVIRRMLERAVNSPSTTSAGRLFDGVASLLGIRGVCTYNGEAPVLLENLAHGTLGESGYHIALCRQGSPMTLDWEPMLKAVLKDAQNAVPLPVISRRLHEGLSDAILLVAREVGVRQVAVTGGCFANRLLTELATVKLRTGGFEPIRHRLVPPGDGGIALGQAVSEGMAP